MRTSTSTIVGRAAAALATVALAGLITVVPAHAEPNLLDDGAITPAELRVWENENAGTTGDAAPTDPRPTTVALDDNAVEYLQVALGALGGMAVVGGLVAATSGRRHGHAHPA
ncbi:hypothetical protein [Knoellia aerolata]|uniref:PDGLE domain-containing protein n=1 Tax=Knoellia aerolata DSM 18566 TaxID=1385519 RepID=A0A0A0K4F1_9MICO|nr:hypothetical protein [Knoellia aerolata]KGN42701.1 hypothetical protein N801_13930 [Knoellia aerolata DSM 18566]